MATRTYSDGIRAFEITLSGTPGGDRSSWTVERVREMSRGGKEILVPGMNRVVASTEEGALARACDRIDKWLLANP